MTGTLGYCRFFHLMVRLMNELHKSYVSSLAGESLMISSLNTIQ